MSRYFKFLGLLILFLEGCQDHSVSLQEMNFKQFLKEKGTMLLIDTRPRDVYLGWIRAESKWNYQGHLKESKSFPVSYLNHVSNAQLTAWFSEVIEHKKGIVLIDEDLKRAQAVAKQFTQFHLPVYFYSILSWKDQNELEYPPRYSLLVPPWWVHKVLTQPQEKQKNVRIFHIGDSDQAKKQYALTHLPHSVFMNAMEVEHPTHFDSESESWVLNSDQKLLEFAKKYRLHQDDLVIVYGFQGNKMAVYRMAVLLKYLGVKDVRVMEESPEEYQNAGYSLKSGIFFMKSKPETNLAFQGRNLFVPFEEVEQWSKAHYEKSFVEEKNAMELVDVRSDSEYQGEISGYTYFKKKGRIFGTSHSPSGANAYNLNFYRDLAGFMRDPIEIQKNWIKQGINPNHHLVFFCGSGWRGSEVLFYSWVGETKEHEALRGLYSNGWQEFSQKAPKNLVEL